MSSGSVLILLGVLILLAPFSGLPFSWLTLVLLVIAVVVIGIGINVRTKKAPPAAATAAAPETPAAGEAPHYSSIA
ncbi:MAG: hypothetical protein KGI41_03715 [Patescibacteria group bacterium]|nr:hypothetical protein [Patescibacteria group bacterium]MDE1966319.1 hypothetical protein [Patescibacteria group bacterium]